jgi:hypothetical protein
LVETIGRGTIEHGPVWDWSRCGTCDGSGLIHKRCNNCLDLMRVHDKGDVCAECASETMEAK